MKNQAAELLLLDVEDVEEEGEDEPDPDDESEDEDDESEDEEDDELPLSLFAAGLAEPAPELLELEEERLSFR